MGMPKQQLVNQIYTTVMEAGEPITRKEICERIGYKKAPNVISIIEDLVRGGWLIETQGQTRNGLPVFKYFLNLIKAEELEEYRMRA